MNPNNDSLLIFYDSFTISELKRECPNVSVDMIRKVLKDLNKQGKIRSGGRGQNARWEKDKIKGIR